MEKTKIWRWKFYARIFIDFYERNANRAWKWRKGLYVIHRNFDAIGVLLWYAWFFLQRCFLQLQSGSISSTQLDSHWAYDFARSEKEILMYRPWYGWLASRSMLYVDAFMHRVVILFCPRAYSAACTKYSNVAHV